MKIAISNILSAMAALCFVSSASATETSLLRSHRGPTEIFAEKESTFAASLTDIVNGSSGEIATSGQDDEPMLTVVDVATNAGDGGGEDVSIAAVAVGEGRGVELLSTENPPTPTATTSNSTISPDTYPFNITDPNEVDCAYLQALYQQAPDIFRGSDMMHIKEMCEKGEISSAEEVNQAVEEWESPNHALDNQVVTLATNICEKALDNSNDLLTAIQDACAQDPRDNEQVLDLAAKLQAEQSPTEDPIELEGTCISLRENRKEIEEAMFVLESRSNEGRRLNASGEHKVTSFELGSELLSMLDCYCDDSNPDNIGCTTRTLKFSESVASSIMEQAEDDFADETPADKMLKLQTSLEKQTQLLRKPSGSQTPVSPDFSSVLENDHDTSIARALTDIEAEACNPPGVQRTPQGGYQVCLYAGPYFECNISWDPHEAACTASSCGGGQVLKLVAETKFCALPHVNLQMELKLCVDVVSDILQAIGRYVPGAEGIMNSYGIHGGCYRLAFAQYDIPQNRFKVIVGPHSKSLFGPFKAFFGAKSYMRFKGYDCNYNDDFIFAIIEEYVRTEHGSGIISNYWGKLGLNMHHASNRFAHKKCDFKLGQWAFFTIDFGIEVDYFFGKKTLWSADIRFISK